VRETADREGAVPFDVPGAELGHHDGHCSFVSIMRKYDLKDPGLLLLAEIVNAADTGNLDANPCAQGLEALAQGFSLRLPDDRENVEAQFDVYDSLYAFCRMQAQRQA
jgi:hypothetical protein